MMTMIMIIHRDGLSTLTTYHKIRLRYTLAKAIDYISISARLELSSKVCVNVQKELCTYICGAGSVQEFLESTRFKWSRVESKVGSIRDVASDPGRAGVNHITSAALLTPKREI